MTLPLGFDDSVDYERRLVENRKLHYKTTFQDLPISVENRRKSVRRGTDPDGEEWKTKMKVPYGYIPGTKGADGDAVDVFVGPCEDAAYAYVVHSNNVETGKFDEDKVMLGFESRAAAKQCFMQHYDDPKFFGGMDAIPMWKFRKRVWVKKHTSKRLVASRTRESYGFSAKSLIHDPKPNTGGQARIFTARRRFRTGGPGSGPHKGGDALDIMSQHASQIPKKVWVEKAGATYVGAMDHPSGGKIHGFKDPKTGSTMWMKGDDIRSAHDVRDHMEQSRRKNWTKKEAVREHGVKGMKWGNRKQRHQKGRMQTEHNPAHHQKAAVQKPQEAPKKTATKPEDLANDPRTLSMMGHIVSGQKTLNGVQSPGKNASADHRQGLASLMKQGWQAVKVGAHAAQVGGSRLISSIMQTPSGHQVHVSTLHTPDKGSAHYISNHNGSPLYKSAKAALGREKDLSDKHSALRQQTGGQGKLTVKKSD